MVFLSFRLQIISAAYFAIFVYFAHFIKTLYRVINDASFMQ